LVLDRLSCGIRQAPPRCMTVSQRNGNWRYRPIDARSRISFGEPRWFLIKCCPNRWEPETPWIIKYYPPSRQPTLR
jgi:hypothetical protein